MLNILFLHLLRCVPPFSANATLSSGGEKLQEGINVSYLIAFVIIGIKECKDVG